MAEYRRNAPQRAAQKPALPSITAKIDRFVNVEGSSIKASASVNIGGAFAIHGIKVIDSPQKGMFVSMPADKYVDREGNTQYSSICNPITAEARNALIETVKNAYEQALAAQQTVESQSNSDDLNPEM